MSGARRANGEGRSGRTTTSPSLIGRQREVAELAQLLSAHPVVSVFGPPGIGKTELVRAGVDRAAVWTDLGGLEDQGEIVAVTAAALGRRAASGKAVPALTELLGDKTPTVVWDDAPAVALELGQALAGRIGSRRSRLVMVSRSAPPVGVPSLEVTPLSREAARELVQALEAERGRSLYDDLFASAAGNPLLLTFAFDTMTARRAPRPGDETQVVVDAYLDLARRELDAGEVRRAQRTLDSVAESEPVGARARTLHLCRLEAFIRSGDLLRAGEEALRGGAAAQVQDFLPVAAALLPALRGDAMQSRGLLRALGSAHDNGEHASAFTISYLCEERYPRAAGWGRRARRAYASSRGSRFESLARVAEIISLVECGRIDRAAALARPVIAPAAGNRPPQLLGGVARVAAEAAVLARRGELGAYLELMDPVVAALDAGGDRVVHAIAARYSARACVALGRFELAERHLRSAALATEAGLTVLRSLTDREWAALDLARGDVEAARQRLGQALLRAPGNPYLAIDAWAVDRDAATPPPRSSTSSGASTAYLALRAAERSLGVGEHDAAAAQARIAERWYDDAGIAYERSRAQLLGAEAQLELGQYALARALLDKCAPTVREQGYAPLCVEAALVAAALGDRSGDLEGYRSALGDAASAAEGALADEALASACRRAGLSGGASVAANPFRRIVERLGLARPATHVISVSDRIFLVSEDEELEAPHDLLVDVEGGYVQSGDQRLRWPEMRLRLFEHLASAGAAGITMEALYLQVWRGRQYHPLRHRNAVYVGLQRLRDALRPLFGDDPVERVADGCYRVSAAMTVAVRRRAELSALQPAACQLPTDIADFTGRGEHVDRLCELLGRGRTGDGAVSIGAIAGLGGVGKTVLALHVAHRLRSDFPDGQLYVNLGGAEATPAEPAHVLGRFLLALGVESSAIPEGLEERAVLYRGLLADRKVLVVLDNAAGEAQVRPLLPGSASSAVLVTSRVRLTGLPGVSLVDLDAFEPAHALELLARMAGHARVSAEQGTAAEIARLCGYLPLAVRIVGARLAARPHWSLADLAGRLRQEQPRLDELTAGDLAVRSSLAMSYGALEPGTQRAFRLLGLLDAPDFAPWVLDALLGTRGEVGREHIDALADARMLACAGSDATGELRYRFHDLVRLYARECARETESPEQRSEALARALGGWLALADAADAHLDERVASDIPGPAERWRPEAAGEGITDDALSWFESERASLVASVGQAASEGLADLAWELAARSVTFFAVAGHYDDWFATHMQALDACTRAEDRRGEAVMLRNLVCLRMTGMQSLPGVILTGAEKALATFRDLAEPEGEVDVLLARAYACRHRGDYAEALACGDSAMTAAEAIGYELGQTRAWYLRAVICREQGRYAEAFDHATRCLELLDATTAVDDRLLALWELAGACRDRRAARSVSRRLERGIETCRRRGKRLFEAYLLLAVGDLAVRFGRRGARVALEEALSVFRERAVLFGQEVALRLLGELDRIEGDADRAVERLGQAAEMARRLRRTHERALTLAALAEAHHARDDPTAAAEAWQTARDLFEQLGNATEAAKIVDRMPA